MKVRDMLISDLIREAHLTAMNKRWHEFRRSPGELLALVHSEVSEALEEIRDGHNLDEIRYRESDRKPEGFTVELADVLIRCFDIMGLCRVKLGENHHTIYSVMEKMEAVPSGHQSPGDDLADLHLLISHTYNHATNPNNGPTANLDAIRAGLGMVIDRALQICIRRDLPIERALEEKLEFNKNRPERHGGKTL